jgi:hypothetical protein
MKIRAVFSGAVFGFGLVWLLVGLFAGGIVVVRASYHTFGPIGAVIVGVSLLGVASGIMAFMMPPRAYLRPPIAFSRKPRRGKR